MNEILREFFEHIDAEIAAGRLRLLLWFCPDDAHKGVTWARTEAGAVPTCDVCGATGAPR